MLYKIVLMAASRHSVEIQKGANQDYTAALREYCDAFDILLDQNAIEEDEVEASIGDDGSVHIVFYSAAFEFCGKNNPMTDLIARMQAFSVCDTGTERGLEFECVFPSLWD